jgi:hypothetical protein
LRIDPRDSRKTLGFQQAARPVEGVGLVGMWPRGAAKKSRWGRYLGREGLQMWPEELEGLGHASPPSIRRANAPDRPA